ncbi:hypothetical protein F4778DRAFT_718901 [Xylariomycetidae sp. FL2044]|nr:hypothetical protein F4778DRAFT_718901 [Xylariomycetidae sp. FL2044]
MVTAPQSIPIAFLLSVDVSALMAAAMFFQAHVAGDTMPWTGEHTNLLHQHIKGAIGQPAIEGCRHNNTPL